MKRIKRHKVKTEKPESSHSRDHEEHDLAYYIHDRVELMHQVFSILKYKELKAMAPECIRNLAVGDLQELCTEELLGISSKRLLATLDGAEPPSDTESSSASQSPDRMETISLDSISSDEEILSQNSKKKKHKHHRNSKSKSKKKEKEKQDPEAADDTTEVSKASRAGLTVLELLELQARARAIRAQLQNEQAKKQSEAAAAEKNSSTDDEVEIKEEAPDVVEISSGDEKPDLTTLQQAVQKPPKSREPAKSKESEKTKEPPKPKELKEPQNPKRAETNEENPEKTTVTRRINDLTITVPQAKTTRKIKLKRNKVTVTIPNAAEKIPTDDNRIVTIAQKPAEETLEKSKKKKKRKKKSLEKDGSDHDEITLQLSDSEKMDLLEDLNEKNYDKLSSSSSDSEASSSDTATEISTNSLHTNQNKSERKDSGNHDTNVVDNTVQNSTEHIKTNKSRSNSREEIKDSIETSATEGNTNKEMDHASDVIDDNIKDADNVAIAKSQNLPEDCDTESHVPDSLVITQESTDKTDAIETELTKVTDHEVFIEENNDKSDVATKVSTDDNPNTETPYETETGTVQVESNVITEKPSQPKEVDTEHKGDVISISTTDDIPVINEDTQELKQIVDTNENTDSKKEKDSERDISEGELSDRESSEVEALDVQPEVVCISDDEQQKTSKKKKKKDKKAKKEKKSKKSKQDFREGADQNFYKDNNLQTKLDDIDTEDPIDITDDDAYEILELSDDSSCYEVEGTVLSKEPTTEEIEALSAKLDNIKKEDLVINQQNKSTPVENNPEKTNSDSEQESEYISWKDRYLGSKKVKKVLTTANILNAIRKKNKELKKKIEESKKKELEEQTKTEEKVLEEQTEKEKVLEVGSIEHYQTLPPSKYINPVDLNGSEVTEDGTKNIDEKAVTREMKKDAKQLLKMYRKLLNCRKEKRREKKKIRKQRKQLGNDCTLPVTSSMQTE